MSKYRMAERAVLMRLSAGLPGKHRKDRALSDKVKGEHNLGQSAGAKRDAEAMLKRLEGYKI